MKIFAISDLHLSINNPKPMDIFGPACEAYLDKIIDDCNSKVGNDDIVLISGDISWAMKFENAKPDLDLICNLKGTKIILKGNHDYWWSSISELREYLHNNTYAIQNDAYKFGDFVICGSRGWIPFDNGFKSELDEKIYKREIIRMELSLRSAKTLKTNNEKIVVMTHFPPYNYRLENNEMIELFKKYDVDVVVYGHLHNEDKSQKLEFERDGIKYFLTSCDLVGNKLIRIL